MKAKDVIELLNETPIIAAIKNQQGLEECLHCHAPIVFVLYGTVVSLPDIVQQVHDAGKLVIVHIDLIDGLSPREVAVEYIAKNTCADGIISTKPSLLKKAHEKGLIAIRRFFLLDSMALRAIEKQITADELDLIEVLPGVIMPKIMQKVSDLSKLPLIAGGLISDKEDVMHALASGAIAVSSTDPSVWYM